MAADQPETPVQHWNWLEVPEPQPTPQHAPAEASKEEQ